MVLAEETAAGAAREENGARAIPAGNTRLFAKMRTDIGDPALPSFSTETVCSGQAVGMADTGAQGAALILLIIESDHGRA